MSTAAPEPASTGWLLAMGHLLRALPVGMRGKARLARLLLKSDLTTRDLTVDGADGMSFLLPSLAESIGFHLFIDGIYEPDEVRWVLAQLTPGDIFVDVGANIGAFSVPAGRKVGATGRVIAIEASPRISAYLTRNVALNDLTNVTILNLAADRVSRDSVPFYDAPVERFGFGSLTPAYGGTMTTVPARRLDDILAAQAIGRVKILKIDVEGFEAAVLTGAEQILCGPNPPMVLFEFYDWAERTAGTVGESQRLLRDWGYQIWPMGSLTAAPLGEHDTPVGNLVAIRKDQRPVLH